MKGIGCARSTGGAEADRKRALIGAIKDLCLDAYGGNLPWISFVAGLGKPVVGGVAARRLQSELVFGAGIEELVTAIEEETQFGIRHWADRCKGNFWCATSCVPKAAVARAAKRLLAKMEPDKVLEDAMERFGEMWVGAAARRSEQLRWRIVVYEVTERGLAGYLGDYLTSRLERAAPRRFELVAKRKLVEAVRKGRIAPEDLNQGLPPRTRGIKAQKRGACDFTDVIINGSFAREGDIARLDLVMLDCESRLLGGVTAPLAVAALPEEVKKRVADEESERQKLYGLVEEQRDERTVAWDRERDNWENGKQRAIIRQLEAKKDFTTAQGVMAVGECGAGQGGETADSYQAYEMMHSEWKSGDEKDSPLIVKVWMDKGCGATYEVGENPIVFVRCNRDCYVKVFHRSSEGELKLIFPNRCDPDNLLHRGENPLGSTQYQSMFEVTEPLGVELITAVASERQFDDLTNFKGQSGVPNCGVVGYGTVEGAGYRKVLYRGLTVKPRNVEIPDGATISRANCSMRVVAPTP